MTRPRPRPGLRIAGVAAAAVVAAGVPVFAATAAGGEKIGGRAVTAAPTVRLTKKPPRTTTSQIATFRYAVGRGEIVCLLDGRRRSCARRNARVTARPGKHVFRIKAVNRLGTSSASWRWTVVDAQSARAKQQQRTSTRRGTSSPSPSTSPASTTTTPQVSTTPGPSPSDRPLLLSEDFDGSALDASKWGVYGPNWPGNGGYGLRDGRAVSVGGGLLTITAKMVGRTLVSGAIATKFNQAYGRVEFRVRTDADPSGATSGVVLMWPQYDDDWPVEGEEDIYETGTNPTRDGFSSFAHYGADNKQYWFGHDADATQWHTMAMDWTPTAIRFYRDGALAGTVTDPAAVVHSPHHLCIQLDAFANRMGSPVKMQVDWVRIYGAA